MNVSNLRVLIKTRNKYDVSLIVFSVFSLFLPFLKVEATTISVALQSVIVAFLFIAAVLFQITNQVGIKIPVFEYNLKLISHKQIKLLLVAKCSLYSIAIYLCITSFLILNPLVDIVLKISLVFHVMLSSVSRRLEYNELGVLVIFAILAIKLPFVALIALYIIYYLLNSKIKLDFTSMYKLSLMVNAFLLETNSDIKYKERGKHSKILNWKFNKLTLFVSRVINLIWYLIVPLILLLLLMKITDNNSVYIIMTVISASRVVLDKVAREDLGLYRAKVISAVVFKSMFKIDIAIYGIFMLLNFALVSLLVGLSLKWIIVFIVISIYFIALTPKEISGIKIMIMDSLVIIIMSLFVFL